LHILVIEGIDDVFKGKNDKHTLEVSTPLREEAEFTNFVSQIEHDECYLIVPDIVSQLEVVGMNGSSENTEFWDFKHAVISFYVTVINISSPFFMLLSAVIRFPAPNIVISKREMHGYTCVWYSQKENMRIHPLGGVCKNFARKERRLAIMSMRYEEARMLKPFVFFNEFVSCVGTNMKPKEQLRFIWDPSTCNCLRTHDIH
ncbi:hypothetical protein KI387_043037, partial [Taxus chinensis]